ncbi:MAG: hypothetical protein LBB54_04020 [Cellulomonadaceae bacterium]|jgi:glutathione synthase/RimK-type ligase-like ATP-grasp enzyme|nr:hypothetical protein [Cellulomonadaceae bacterium]
MSDKRVALATCTDVHGLAADDQPLVPELAKLGITAEPVVWNNPEVDWTSYDLTVIRSTWDYATQQEEFIQWAQSVPHLANPASVIAWDTDRRYLMELEKAGIPVIPTIWLEPSHHLSKRAIHSRMPAFGDFVVKPVVSAGAKDIARYQPISAQSRSKAITHTQRLLDSDRWVMIQPYVTSIDTDGETCMTFVDGQFCHAVRRHALLGGNMHQTLGLTLYPNNSTRSVEATPEQIDVAQRALALAKEATGESEDFLYARVDLVKGEEGPLVIEIELTEPSLWMRYSGGAPTLKRLTQSIARRVGVPVDAAA